MQLVNPCLSLCIFLAAYLLVISNAENIMPMALNSLSRSEKGTAETQGKTVGAYVVDEVTNGIGVGVRRCLNANAKQEHPTVYGS